MVKNENGSFDIRYAISEPGEYQMNVKFGGKDIPNGSFSFKVSQQTRDMTPQVG